MEEIKILLLIIIITGVTNNDNKKVYIIINGILQKAQDVQYGIQRNRRRHRRTPDSVSYTHLDVYKRQVLIVTYFIELS